MSVAATRRSAAQPRTVAILLYGQCTLLDVAGPAEVFAVASSHAPAGAPGYRIRTYGATPGPSRAESALTLLADAPLPRRIVADTLVVPGGSGLRDPATLARVAEVLRRSRASVRRIVSVCTGAYALAEAGLLDGRVAATHWAFAADFARRYPRVAVDAGAIYRKHERLATSAGVTAGIDLCLSLVQDDLGHDVAMATARELVVYLRRSGSQAQFSGPLQLQDAMRDRLAAMHAWMMANPSQPFTLEALAARAHLSPRQLQRRVRESLGLSVSQLVERVRIDEARRLLAEAALPLSRIARACGYGSADALSRAFLRHTGLRPLDWRQRFDVGAVAGREPGRGFMPAPARAP